MTDTRNAAFAEPWRQLWNGDLAQLDAIVAENFVAHAALAGMGEGALRGRAALGQWIGPLAASVRRFTARAWRGHSAAGSTTSFCA